MFLNILHSTENAFLNVHILRISSVSTLLYKQNDSALSRRGRYVGLHSICIYIHTIEMNKLFLAGIRWRLFFSFFNACESQS